ncbi:hypothetical protein QFC21_003995 [Naganishia friedmannii]|uniref:Uncharacterized protein n=1 Tax=Naganishia friedmannii TaxID=89922 RepID=A0ACC2VKI3_9TREE|nr:hypothetical protein QFC21_003995 [Naganishia friedmannii]
MLTVKTIVLFALAAQSACGALFPRHGPVKDLSAKDFKKELGDGMVLFSAPWCGYCKQVAPSWSRAAETLSPLVPFYNIDCDEEANKRFCASEGVQGYPTIKTYPRGAKSAGRVYTGVRETKDLIDYATSMVSGDKVKKIKKTHDIDTWLTERPEIPHVLLLHPSSHSVPLMWKVLANRLAGKMAFGFHRDDQGATKKAIGIDMKNEKVDQVRVILWNLNGEKEIYEAGPLKFEPLIKYFTHIIGENPVPVEDVKSSSKTSSSTSSVAASATSKAQSSAAKAAEEKRREMEDKWQEEEQRDQLRREKREKDRLARVFEDQDRLAEGEYDDPSPIDNDAEEKVKVVHVGHATPEDPVQAEIDAALHELEEFAATAAAAVHSSKGAAHHHRTTDQSADTPLQEESEDFEHGESHASDAQQVADDGHSATTPLEQEAEEFEHGVDAAVELQDGRVKDEL